MHACEGQLMKLLIVLNEIPSSHLYIDSMFSIAIVHSQKCCSSVWTLTCAHMISRVRVPPLICSTYCCHSPSWNKLWVTHERYLSTLSCVLIWINGTIHRRSGITTVDWRGEMESNVLENYPVITTQATVGSLQWVGERRETIQNYEVCSPKV